jgi:UTP-glucose-1-phosphate uridylyltransferase
MHLKYLHYFGSESNDSILEAYGMISKDKQISEKLRSKQCPQCNEPNKPNSKFCAKCRMVLTYDAYSETLKKEQEKESEVQSLRAEVKTLQDEQKHKAEEILCMLAQFKEQLNQRDQRQLEAHLRNGQ